MCTATRFRPGDKALLKMSRVVVVVEGVDEELGMARCAWLTDGGVKRFTFLFRQLERLPPEAEGNGPAHALQ